jgi:hypothetical protein
VFVLFEEASKLRGSSGASFCCNAESSGAPGELFSELSQSFSELSERRSSELFELLSELSKLGELSEALWAPSWRALLLRSSLRSSQKLSKARRSSKKLTGSSEKLTGSSEIVQQIDTRD